ncbi:MAG: hypothetical protein ABIL78_06805 [candidate division WOR-3 bacterium]
MLSNLSVSIKNTVNKNRIEKIILPSLSRIKTGIIKNSVNK